MTDVKKIKQKSEAIKLNEVKNGKSTVDGKKDEKTKERNEVVAKTAREVSQEVVNKTVRKAVRSAEVQRKYPPPPGTIQRLSEPTHATYVALYNKYCDVLKPKTIGSVKEKIAAYLETIEERNNHEKLVKQKQMLRRKMRKLKAKEEEKSNEYISSCVEQIDEIFEMILEKFTIAYNEGMPQPLVMGPKSRELQQQIKLQMMEILNPVTDVTATADAKVKSATTPTTTTTDATSTSTTADASPPTNSTAGTHSTTGSDLTAANGSTIGTDSTTGFDKNKEFDRTIDILSYFIMEFVKKSLVEAVKVDRI